MKILYYNWVDYLDAEKRGGGISVYQRNLMHAFKDRDDIEAWFISAGISYDMFNATPRWERCHHGTSDEPRRFEIVNSATLAPSHFSFGNPTQVAHDATVEAFYDFIRTHGPFDVVHFNSLEGIPAEVLNLKQEWPETKLIVALHNYYPFCPQVNLWQQEQRHCEDYDGGHNCRSCLLHKPDEQSVRLANAVAYKLKKNGFGPGTPQFDKGFAPAMRLARGLVRMRRRMRRPNPAEEVHSAPRNAMIRMAANAEFPISPYPAAAFRARRERMLELMNRNCDHVLGVSRRVSEIAVEFGVNPEIVSTSYIGTRQDQKFRETVPRPSLLNRNGDLTLGFLGYMREDKGYFFLIQALEQMPDEMAKRVRVVLAAPRRGDTDYLRALSGHLREVAYSDGYSHDQLDDILAEVTLGVVPVQWEDNLPQVAIEMHARHIPLLTSNRGGAQELGNCEKLIFKAGDIGDFHARIRDVLDGKIDMKRYWLGARAPTSMGEHIDSLMDYYTTSPARKLNGATAEPREIEDRRVIL